MAFDKKQYDTNYVKANVRQFIFKLNRQYDQEMIQHLEGQKNINEYLKTLILQDMDKQSKK